MGQQLNDVGQNPDQNLDFTQQLLRDLRALEIMLEEDMFETDVERIGAEQELCLVDEQFSPSPMAMEILEKIKDRHIVTEYARFNLEINLDPLPFQGDCFSKLEQNLNRYLAKIAAVASEMNTQLALVGILPTIRQRDLEFQNMTPLPRYKQLSDNLSRLRGGRPFNFYIHGTDELQIEHPSSLLESCNTSYQIHYQINPRDFPAHYNFAQLISAPVLAAATNSCLLFGRRLWKETRIALFRQSIDTRHTAYADREQSPRVTFGSNWAKDSILDVFRDDISRFRQILAADVPENALKTLQKGKIPKLKALCLFNGSVYRWNRACYGIYKGKPHLRIENRILPAGPSVVDEVANTAFFFGLMKGRPPEYDNLQTKLSFDMATTNFFKAAKMGVDSQFHWLNDSIYDARELITKELLPIARQGLEKANVHPKDIDKYLGIVENRVNMRRTGAIWMFESFNRLRNSWTRYESAVAITASMVNRQQSGKPVHEWTLAEMKDAQPWRSNFWRIEQIMSTDLYTVHENDLVDLAVHIMSWKHIRHVPVEDENGKLVGLIDDATLLKYIGNQEMDIKKATVSDIMTRNPKTIPPDTLTLDAIQMMQEHHISCLPVEFEGKLVGIITENDFTRITAELLEKLAKSQVSGLNQATTKSEDAQEQDKL